jgi:hypothetical protein
MATIAFVSPFSIFLFSGGTAILPKSIQENELINKLTRPYHEVCDIENEGGKMTWLRLVSDKKGRWHDPLTKAPPQYENWRRGKYAETEDNCAFLLSGDIDKDGKWSSSTCTEQSPRFVFIDKPYISTCSTISTIT